jgi:hypothetical protein
MTVSTEVNQAAYTGNGVTTVFPYTFRILNSANLTVTRIDLQEVETVLTLGTDYTVTGAGSYNGGSVVLPQALPSGYSLVIERDLPMVQETDLRNQGTFFAEVHEDAFDYLTMIIQQVATWLGLALRRPTVKTKFYDAKGNRIANLGNPVNAQDATTKSYVDAADSAVLQQANASILRTLRVPESSVGQLGSISSRRNSLLGFNNSGDPIPIFSMTETADLAIKLASSQDGVGDALIAVKQPFPTSKPRTQHDKNAEFPTILDWDSDSLNDDTTRITKAVADGVQYLDIPQGSFKVSNLVINKAIRLNGRGKQGLNGIGTLITVDPDADFGIFFDSTGNPRPTGGGISHMSLKCAVRNTGNPDLLKAKSWSYFTAEGLELGNTQGWCIRLQDFMESEIIGLNFRAFGSESTGGILFDDYLTASYNNVNNLHVEDCTFGGGSGPWISSTAQSNPDLIWIKDIKFEWDGTLSAPNTSNKYVIDFLNMARCWIDKCGFTHLADINNMYQAALHMGPLCGFSTEFTDNKLYGMRSPWLVEGGSLIAHGNTSNQADYATGSNMGGIITSNKFCDVEPVKHVTSNGAMTRGKLPKDPGYITAHELGGNTNNAFVVDSSASQSTVMSVSAATQIRNLPIPASVLDGTSVLNLTLRIRCSDTAGANGTIAVVAGSTTLFTRTVIAANGWQLIKVQLKPSQLTTTVLSITNTGTVAVMFDGAKMDKSSYIDWNFAFSPGSIAAGAVVTSPVQSYTDTIGTASLIQSISQAKFDAASTGLIASINTVDSNGSFTLSLYNPTGSVITPAITRAFVRIFLN